MTKKTVPAADRANITELDLQVLLDAYDLQAQQSTRDAGARGGKTVRQRRVDIEKFMRDQHAQGITRRVVLDLAAKKFGLSHETLEKRYLRPLKLAR